jgi:hypothetical protein
MNVIIPTKPAVVKLVVGTLLLREIFVYTQVATPIANIADIIQSATRLAP